MPVDPTVAKAGLLLLHVPPTVASVNVVVEPTQTTAVPPKAAGWGFTVTGCTEKHPPAVNVKVIVGIPAATPVTTPVADPTVANAVLLLLHVPGDEASLNVVVSPTQTFIVPVIAAGCVLTVTGFIAKQPAGKVYDIFNVPVALPTATPLLAPMVANAGNWLVHVPPPIPSVIVVGTPMQRVLLPTIAGGVWLTVTNAVAEQPAGKV
jgi:hypothetical protein